MSVADDIWEEVQRRKAALDALEESKGKSTEWISVEDRLPELNTWVVGYRKARKPFICQWRIVKEDLYNGTACMDTDNNFRSPTNWMPLPQPPTDKE